MHVTPYCDAIASQFERQGFSDLKYAYYPKEILDSLCRFFYILRCSFRSLLFRSLRIGNLKGALNGDFEVT